jgi:RimJ/RimL family protein N-acetyltransferase
MTEDARTPALSDVDLWPLAELRVRCGDLTLRAIDDDLLLDLARLAADGVHAPDAMPFTTPWTRGTPLEVARSVLAYQWSARASVSPERFAIELAVVRARPDADGGDEVLGVQALMATDFAVTRVVETGSWLGRRHQGQGVGRRMRHAALHLAFAGLGAESAVTTAFADNAASNGVTRAIGYAPDGVDVVAREGTAAVSQRYRLVRETWESRTDRPAVSIEGLGPVRVLLGLDAPAGA